MPHSEKSAGSAAGVTHAGVGKPASAVDTYAIVLSALCLLHCLLPPLLWLFLPTVAQFAEAEWIHQYLVLLAAPATLWIAYHSFSDGTAFRFIALAIPGLSLLVVAAYVSELESVEVVLTVIGAALLAFAHWSRMTRLRHRYDSNP